MSIIIVPDRWSRPPRNPESRSTSGLRRSPSQTPVYTHTNPSYIRWFSLHYSTFGYSDHHSNLPWTPQTPSSKSKGESPHLIPKTRDPRSSNQLKTNLNRDVLNTLQTSRPLFSSYLRIRSLAKSPQNPELQQARSELETTLSELSADLDDLVESVRAVELDPYRYGLELEEVSRRRGLVNDVGREVEEMRTELQKAITDTTTTTSGAAGDSSRLPLPEDFDQDLPPEERDDDYYAAMEEQRQAELMHEQDEQLDGVFRTVGHLREQANDMGRELESQAVMLGEVDTLADRVGGKLQGGMSRLKHIVRQNEGEFYGSFCFRYDEEG